MPRLGTRGSALARWQAEHLRTALLAAGVEEPIEVEVIATTGDRILDSPLSSIGGKGLFVKEIEEALLEGRIDLAVHSLKDLPTSLPDGLAIGAVLPREDPRDALFAPRATLLADLPAGGRIGTSSLRRQAQILHERPDLAILPLRGNVPTRLRKMEEGRLDGVVLAAAGAIRLGMTATMREMLDPRRILPAPGQGAIAVEVRADDRRTRELVRGVECPATRMATEAERTLLAWLGGGCQVPVGALARIDETGRIVLMGMVASTDGKSLLRGTAEGDRTDPAGIGARLAEELLARGAREILRELGVEGREGGPG